jgi:hypothetical protein
MEDLFLSSFLAEASFFPDSDELLDELDGQGLLLFDFLRWCQFLSGFCHFLILLEVAFSALLLFMQLKSQRESRATADGTARKKALKARAFPFAGRGVRGSVEFLIGAL